MDRTEKSRLGVGNSKAALLLAAAAGMGSFGQAANAATFYWDGGQTTANNALDSGSGTWDTTTTNWTNAAGTSNFAWSDGNAATFTNPLTAGVTQTVTLGVPSISMTGDLIVSGAGVGGTTITGGAINLGGNISVTNPMTSAQALTATALTINSDLALGAATRSFNLGSGSTNANVVVNGTISGTGVGITSGNSAATNLTLNGVNTFTGAVTIARGAVQVSSVANGGSSSGLGSSANLAGNLVISSATAGTLRLVSGGSTANKTDRLLTLDGSNNTASIENSSVSPGATLEFTNTGNVAFTGGTANQNRTLALGGSNAGVNIFSLKLTDPNATGATVGGIPANNKAALLKQGVGTWRVTNDDSNFTGGVSATGGILEFTTVAAAGTKSSLGAGSTISVDKPGGSGANTNIDAGFRFIGSTAQATDRALANNGTGQNSLLDRMTLDASGTVATATLSFTNTGNLANAGGATNVKQLVLTGTNTGKNLMQPNIIGPTQIIKNGVGTWVLAGANTNSAAGNGQGAGTTVNAGTLIGTQNGGSPFGVAAIAINAGILSFAPDGTSLDVSAVGGSTAIANNLFSFGPDAVFSLAKGSNSSLTYTFSRSNASGSAFSRGTNGTLILSVSAIGNLGSTVASGGERFLVTGGSAPVPTTNGLVSGVVAQDRASANAGEFVTYGATNGFVAATPNQTDTFSGSTNARYVNVVSSGVSTGAAVAAYALKVNGQTLTNSSSLTLGGSAAGVGSLILNGGTISGGTITTPANGTELLVYTSGTSAISSSINTATGQTGLSLFGPGTLNVSASTGNSFTGGLRINNSTLIASNDNQLGGSTSAITLTGGTLQTSGTVALGGASRAITLNVGQDKTGGTFNVTSGTTTLTNAASGSKLISGAGSLTKSGAGTLILAGDTANTYTGGTVVGEGRLLVNTSSGTGTGAVSVTSVATLGGTGSISGAVNVSGILAPGASVESLASGTLSFATGSTFAVEVDSSAALASAADLQRVNGDLNLAGTVSLTLADLANSPAKFATGTKFTLINYTSGAWNGGLFSLGSALADDTNFTIGLNTWSINYNDITAGVNFVSDQDTGGSNRYVTITSVVPEPTGVVAVGGFAVLALRRGRRRSA